MAGRGPSDGVVRVLIGGAYVAAPEPAGASATDKAGSAAGKAADAYLSAATGFQ